MTILSELTSRISTHWRAYLLQSAAASLTLFICLLILNIQHIAVVASIGATAFIVFALPKTQSAQFRNVIGGHSIGLLAGTFWSLWPSESLLVSSLFYSAAVGTTFIAMLVFRRVHPPAGGTALGVAVSGFSAGVGLAVIVSIIILSFARIVMFRFLYDFSTENENTGDEPGKSD